MHKHLRARLHYVRKPSNIIHMTVFSTFNNGLGLLKTKLGGRFERRSWIQEGLGHRWAPGPKPGGGGVAARRLGRVGFAASGGGVSRRAWGRVGGG